MELIDYVAIFKKRLWQLLTIVLLVAGALYLYAARQPIIHEGQLTLNVLRVPDVGLSTDYKFDSFYTLEASKSFTDVVSGWFSDPAMTEAIYRKAGIAMPAGSLSDLSGVFAAKKLSAVSISVRYSDLDQANVGHLLDAAREVADDRAAELDAKGLAQGFKITAYGPVIVEAHPQAAKNGAVGAVLGFLLGLVYIYLAEYFASAKKR